MYRTESFVQYFPRLAFLNFIFSFILSRFFLYVKVYANEAERKYGAPEGTRKLKSFEWLDCTNNKVLNVAIAQTIKF